MTQIDIGSNIIMLNDEKVLGITGKGFLSKRWVPLTEEQAKILNDMSQIYLSKLGAQREEYRSDKQLSEVAQKNQPKKEEMPQPPIYVEQRKSAITNDDYVEQERWRKAYQQPRRNIQESIDRLPPIEEIREEPAIYKNYESTSKNEPTKEELLAQLVKNDLELKRINKQLLASNQSIAQINHEILQKINNLAPHQPSRYREYNDEPTDEER